MHPNEIQVLASAVNRMRPDWPIRSIATWLATDHADRPYRDVAVALVWVACDPDTHTPKRMNEAGPWWAAAAAERGRAPAVNEPPHHARCALPGHGSYLASNCGACRSEQLADDSPRPVEPANPSYATGPAHVRAAMEAAGIPTTKERP